jgi:hypothetical protein
MDKYAPFHISVAATAVQGGEERVWYSEENGQPALNLTPQRAHELLEYLEDMQRSGYQVCAWNGLGFDLKWIGHHAEDLPLAARIALDSYDPMFQFFNQTGYPVALANVAQAMGIPQQKLMDGADAPIQWRDGNHQAVMDYVLGDCQMTNLIINAILETRQVRWLTTKGYIKAKPMPKLKPAREIITEPIADQSWMDNPIPKNKFYGWAMKGLEDRTAGKGVEG